MTQNSQKCFSYINYKMKNHDNQNFFFLQAMIQRSSLLHYILWLCYLQYMMPKVAWELFLFQLSRRTKEHGESLEGGFHGQGMEVVCIASAHILMVRIQLHDRTQVQSRLEMQSTLLRKKRKQVRRTNVSTTVIYVKDRLLMRTQQMFSKHSFLFASLGSLKSYINIF